MSRVVLTVIESCSDCKYRMCIESIDGLKYECSRIHELTGIPRLIAKYPNNSYSRLISIPIPGWCPLDNLDPKFVEV